MNTTNHAHGTAHVVYSFNGIYKVKTCIKFKSLKPTNVFLIDRCGLESDDECKYVSWLGAIK